MEQYYEELIETVKKNDLSKSDIAKLKVVLGLYRTTNFMFHHLSSLVMVKR